MLAILLPQILRENLQEDMLHTLSPKGELIGVLIPGCNGFQSLGFVMSCMGRFCLWTSSVASSIGHTCYGGLWKEVICEVAWLLLVVGLKGYSRHLRRFVIGTIKATFMGVRWAHKIGNCTCKCPFRGDLPVKMSLCKGSIGGHFRKFSLSNVANMLLKTSQRVRSFNKRVSEETVCIKQRSSETSFFLYKFLSHSLFSLDWVTHLLTYYFAPWKYQIEKGKQGFFKHLLLPAKQVARHGWCPGKPWAVRIQLMGLGNYCLQAQALCIKASLRQTLVGGGLKEPQNIYLTVQNSLCIGSEKWSSDYRGHQ